MACFFLNVSLQAGDAPMVEVKAGDPVQFLDLLLDYFADESGWARGDLDDGRGRRCLVGTIHYLRRQHQISSRMVESLLQEALPHGYCHLALYNDACVNIAELRALIMDARTRAIAGTEPPRDETAGRPGRWRILTRFKRPRPKAGDERQAAEPERLAA
jgi:hypothetical protein